MEIVEVERKNMMLKAYIDTNMDQSYSILSDHSDAFLIIDLQGNIAYVSPKCEPFAGPSKDTVLKKSVKDLFVKKYLNDTQTFFNGREQENLENFDSQIIIIGEEIVDVNITSIPIFFEKHFLGSYLVLKDITEVKRKRLLRQEQERRHLNLIRKLSQISEKQAAAGQLAAGIAHEIRNPITAIKGFLQLLRSEDHGNNVYFDVMNSEINRIEVILKELMVLAKPSNQKHGRVVLSTLLDQVLTLMESQTLLNNIEIEKEYHALSSRIWCQENQLKQVFINYIKNAIEAMPSGGKLRIEGSYLSDGFLLIKFMDQGCGIPSNILNRIGEPFFTTKENGTGLGMLVSEQIIRDHKGSIKINSNSNGTCVEVKLPLGLEEFAS